MVMIVWQSYSQIQAFYQMMGFHMACANYHIVERYSADAKSRWCNDRANGQWASDAHIDQMVGNDSIQLSA